MYLQHANRMYHNTYVYLLDRNHSDVSMHYIIMVEF